MLSDFTEWLNLGKSIVSGGWATWIVAGVVAVGLGLVYLYLRWNRAKIAEQQSDQKSQKDSGRAVKENQDATKEWQDAQKKTEAAKEEVREAARRNPSDQG